MLSHSRPSPNIVASYWLAVAAFDVATIIHHHPAKTLTFWSTWQYTTVCVCVMKSEIMRTMQVTMCRIMMCVWSQVMVEQSWPRVMGTQVSPGRIHTVCQCSICAMLVLVCASVPWFNCKKPRVGRRSFQRRKKNNAKNNSPTFEIQSCQSIKWIFNLRLFYISP